MIRLYSILICVFSISQSLVNAVDWTHWRGNHYNGVSEGKGVPLEKKIGWKTKTPGPSLATPIVVNGKVFTSALKGNKGQKMLALAYTLEDGKKIWEKELGSGGFFKRDANATAPSPVSDGKSIYYLTAFGVLVSLNLDGEKLWKVDLSKDFGEFPVKFGYASSPLLVDGKLIVSTLKNESIGDSYVIGIDSSNGKVLWGVTRPSKAIQETFDSYSSPLPMVF